MSLRDSKNWVNVWQCSHMALVFSYWPISMCARRAGIILSYTLSHRCSTGISFGPNPFLMLNIPSQFHCRHIWRRHTTVCWWYTITLTDMHARQSQLPDCLSALHSWFCHNGLALNNSKFESILIGTRQRLRIFPSVASPTIAGTPIQFSQNHQNAWRHTGPKLDLT